MMHEGEEDFDHEVVEMVEELTGYQRQHVVRSIE